MQNEQERLSSLHERMERLLKKRERRRTAAIGAAGVILGVCLFILIFKEGASGYGYTPGSYSGSMLLFENAGGYVLVALLSFLAAVVVTILCIRWKKKNDRTNQEKDEHKEGENHEE